MEAASEVTVVLGADAGNLRRFTFTTAHEGGRR